MTSGQRSAGALAVAWVLLGSVLWGVGIVGVGVGLEDRCLEVAVDDGYGASSQSASVWPPRFTCELSGPEQAAASDRLDVEQVDAALLRTGWTLGFPVAWFALGVAVRLRTPTDGRPVRTGRPRRGR